MILVTNDDGYDAPGLLALLEAVSPLDDAVVVAPEREQSGSSHALTLSRPLRMRQVSERRYRVDGTPTDCVHLGVERLTGGRLPRLVVSGMNRGLNVGDDVTYSGTVAGALEAHFSTCHRSRSPWRSTSTVARISSPRSRSLAACARPFSSAA